MVLLLVENENSMRTLTLSLLLSFCLLSRGQDIWFQIPSNTVKRLNAIDFPSNSVGYIGGNDSLLLKTINGGKSWQKLNPSGIGFLPTAKNIIHLEFVNESKGYLILDSQNPSNLLFKTMDGGQNWIPDSASICYPKTTYFFDQDNGLAGGGGCFQGEYVERFVNGKWQGSQFIGVITDTYIRTIDFLNNNIGMAAGNSKYIFLTSNGGISWDTIPILLDTGITDILIVNDTLAYATFTKFGDMGVLISTDGGQTWDFDWSVGSFLYPGFFAVSKTSTEKLYFGGISASSSVGIMQYESNTFWFTDMVDHFIYDLDTYGNSTVFAVGDSGYIITNADPTFISVSTIPDVNEVSIYPNPTRSELIVEIPFDGTVLYSITDVQGRHILTDVKISGGRININLSGTKPGVYFLSLEFGDQQIIKRIIKIE